MHKCVGLDVLAAVVEAEPIVAIAGSQMLLEVQMMAGLEIRPRSGT